jgi:hypothetical protein
VRFANNIGAGGSHAGNGPMHWRVYNSCTPTDRSRS